MKATRPLALAVAALTAIAGGCAKSEVRVVTTTDKLAATTMVGPLDHALDPAQNTLWCATAPLAWSELKKLVGGPVAVVEGPEWIDALNRSSVTGADVAESARVADAGRVGDGVIDRIAGAVRARFGRDDPLLAQLRGLPADGLVAYARLEKDLRFATPFDRHDSPMAFRWPGGQVKIDVFGVEDFDGGKARHQKLAKQVRIHDYKSNEDFVVVVETTGDDEVILARIPPNATLRATVDATLSRISTNSAGRLRHGDVLAIPRFDFELTHDYRDIAGKALANRGFEGATIAGALQSVLFRMDEEGVTLRSTFAVGVLSAPIARRLVFSGPFLVVLRERGAANPYYAMWVANAELWNGAGAGE